jgi:hypothetical protein
MWRYVAIMGIRYVLIECLLSTVGRARGAENSSLTVRTDVGEGEVELTSSLVPLVLSPSLS